MSSSSASARTSSPFAQLRDFLGYLATVKGDLSNITAPPFLLSPRSVTEMPVACAERQDLFLAPAHEDDPELRALLVLKSFLCGLKRQGYHATTVSSPGSSTTSTPRSSASLSRTSSPGSSEVELDSGRSASPPGPRPKEALPGAKKPLNAFLGELFLAKFLPSDQYRRRSVSSNGNRSNSVGSATSSNADDDDSDATLLFVEQVSHHPPSTACYTYNEAHGMSSEGFVAQETSFSPTSGVKVSQVGYAIVRDATHNESHLMTLPTMLLKGLLTGRPYPELDGSCYISSSSGYLATVGFFGTNSFGMGKKNSFNARICNIREDSSDSSAAVPVNKRKPIYEISGQWTGKMTIKDGRTGKTIEEFDVDDVPLSEARVAPLEKQSPWESRRAWAEVIDGIRTGNMEAIARRKEQIERAQRRMREVEKETGQDWPRMFFHNKQQATTSAAVAAAARQVESQSSQRTSSSWSPRASMDSGKSFSTTAPAVQPPPKQQPHEDKGGELSANAAEYKILARAIPDENLRTVDPTRTGGVWSFIGIGPAMAILRDGLHFRSVEPTTELAA